MSGISQTVPLDFGQNSGPCVSILDELPGQLTCRPAAITTKGAAQYAAAATP
jgi:hypothetical protein